MAAEPAMVAGTGRLCTAIVAASHGAVLAKTGAEGVYAIALGEQGLGVALKVDDGAGRAAAVAVLAVLRRLGSLDEALADFAVAPVRNRAGRTVGAIRAAAGWPP